MWVMMEKFVYIKTERLCIRKFRIEDLNDLHILLSDLEVMKYIEAPFTIKQTEDFLKGNALIESPKIFAVEDSYSRFIGYVIYHSYQLKGIEIGWILKREEWNKGYATELTNALLQNSKKKGEYVIIECSPEQNASIKIAEKFNFSYIGEENNCNVYKKAL